MYRVYVKLGDMIWKWWQGRATEKWITWGTFRRTEREVREIDGEEIVEYQGDKVLDKITTSVVE